MIILGHLVSTIEELTNGNMSMWEPAYQLTQDKVRLQEMKYSRIVSQLFYLKTIPILTPVGRGQALLCSGRTAIIDGGLIEVDIFNCPLSIKFLWTMLCQPFGGMKKKMFLSLFKIALCC